MTLAKSKPQHIRPAKNNPEAARIPRDNRDARPWRRLPRRNVALACCLVLVGPRDGRGPGLHACQCGKDRSRGMQSLGEDLQEVYLYSNSMLQTM
jgi:hypothetical protein